MIYTKNMKNDIVELSYSKIMEPTKLNQIQLNFTSTQINNKEKRKELPKQLRLIIYSYLTYYQSFSILTKLNKSERQSLSFANNYRPEYDEKGLRVNLAELIRKNVNVQNILNFSNKITFSLYGAVYQFYIDFLINVLSEYDKNQNNRKVLVNLNIDTCRNLNQILIKQQINFTKVQLNTLCLKSTILKFSGSYLYPLINLFQNVQLNDSIIGQKNVNNNSDLLSQESNKQVLTCNERYSSIKTLTLINCEFNDLQMLETLENLETFESINSIFDFDLIVYIDQLPQLKQVKLHEWNYISDNFCLSNRKNDTNFYNYKSEVWELNQVKSLKFEKFEFSVTQFYFPFILGDLSKIQLKNKNLILTLDFDLELPDVLYNLLNINCIQLTINCPQIVQFGKKQLDFQSQNYLMKISQAIILNHMNKGYDLTFEFKNVNLNQNQSACIQIKRPRQAGEQIIIINVEQFNQNDWF